jgi:hypothetical protein
MLADWTAIQLSLATPHSPMCTSKEPKESLRFYAAPDRLNPLPSRRQVGHTPMSIRLLSAGLTVLVLSHGGAFSQNWPNRPVRLIVPFPAGGAVDVLARTVFDKVTAQVGQAFVIENRLGAGGTIGSAAVANAAPDGYTILVNSSSHTVAPALFGNLSYDAVRDSRRHPAGKPTDRAVRLR